MPQEPKPKKPFIMWSLPKLGKASKTFSYVMPICGSAVGCGLLYDAPLLGLGFKWGAAIALSLIAVFFVGLVIVTLDSK